MYISSAFMYNFCVRKKKHEQIKVFATLKFGIYEKEKMISYF